jgi:putative FmdB family regulatory protein
MPTYVYACDACGNQFEQFQSFKDDPLKICVCGKEGQIRRVFQPVGVVFKGSGWYITDSRKSETATVNAPASNGAAGEATKTEETKSEKADTAADTKPADSTPAEAKSVETKASSESKPAAA